MPQGKRVCLWALRCTTPPVLLVHLVINVAWQKRLEGIGWVHWSRLWHGDHSFYREEKRGEAKRRREERRKEKRREERSMWGTAAETKWEEEFWALFGALYSFVPGERSCFQLEVRLPVLSHRPPLSPFITKRQRGSEEHCLVQASHCCCCQIIAVWTLQHM